MSNSKSDELKHEIDGLEKTMHDADQFRTLEEQVADMKREVSTRVKPIRTWIERKKMKIGAMTLGKKTASGSQKHLLISMTKPAKTGAVIMASLIHRLLYKRQYLMR